MEIKLNGYNLNDTSVKTNEIQFDTAPPIEVQQLDIAGSDGSKFVASRYGTKIIKILGYITYFNWLCIKVFESVYLI